MRTRFWVAILAVVLLAAGSVVAAALVYVDDRGDLRDMERDEALRAARQAEAVAALSVGELSSAAAFFQAEHDLNAHEFDVVGKAFLRQGALNAAAFIPRVEASRRARFERTHGIEILEFGPAGGLRRAGPRPVYFPLTFVTSDGGRGQVIGFDLGSDPRRAPFLTRARDAGGPVATPLIPLLLGGTGINVYRAIYRDRAPVATEAQRRRALIGFAAGSFRVGDLAAAAIEALSDEVEAQLRVDGSRAAGSAGEFDDGARAPIRIADRTWVLVVDNPSDASLSLPLALAVMGVSLAALLASLIFSWSRRERMQELERQASQDSLTGLGNRRRFEEELAAAMARSRRDRTTGALLILDIDDFKRVNDSGGHPAGDRLIAEVAEGLRRRARQSDSLARIGGDEFAVILPRCSREEARQAAEAIAGEIRGYSHGDEDEPVTVSVGVAMFGDDPRTGVATVVSEADTAMYAAKDAGGGGVRVFDPVSVEQDAPEGR